MFFTFTVILLCLILPLNITVCVTVHRLFLLTWSEVLLTSPMINPLHFSSFHLDLKSHHQDTLREERIKKVKHYVNLDTTVTIYYHYYRIIVFSHNTDNVWYVGHF